jgi:hypothetical protein
VADKIFKVKSGLQVPSLTTAGPVTTDSAGNVTSSATLSITQGGTGQTSSGNALNALLPLQTSQDNKFLQTNGVTPQWSAITSVGTLSSLNVVNGIISVDNSGNQMHLHVGPASSTPTTIFRNDGNGFHILLSDAGAISGGFNSLRPFIINVNNGYITSNNGQALNGGTTIGGALLSTAGQTFSGGTIIASPINAQTATSYTGVYSDAGAITTMNSSSANTFFIPTNASVAYPIGCSITIIQIGAGITTIAATNSGTTSISSNAATSNAPKMRTQFSSATAIKVSNTPEVWYVVGDIA